MTPEQLQAIQDRVTKLEAEKGTISVILESINKSLNIIQEATAKQTEKIDKALVYNEKHDNLSKEVDTLRRDYADKRQEIDRSIGWLKGGFATAGVTVAIIASLMMFIAKDGLNGIKDNGMKIQGVTQQVERLEARINLSNPKSP